MDQDIGSENVTYDRYPWFIIVFRKFALFEIVAHYWSESQNCVQYQLENIYGA